MTWMLFKRMLVSGAKNFTRGGAVSAATVLIMTVTLGIIAMLIFTSALLSFTLTKLTQQINVSVYFVPSASEGDVLATRDQLLKLPQVDSVTYTSADQALAKFREVHASDQITLQGLEELGGNPLSAYLTVQAKDPSQYESIVNFLQASPALSSSGASIIDRINYEQNKPAIDSISGALGITKQIGFFIIVVFALASILIAFATIRLAIYTAKEEIAVMRLVGASNFYIQGPFIVTGIITGVIAAAVVLLLLVPATWYGGIATTAWFGGFNMASYYAGHFILVFLVLMLSGAVLGSVASVLAINKYLQV